MLELKTYPDPWIYGRWRRVVAIEGNQVRYVTRRTRSKRTVSIGQFNRWLNRSTP